MQKAECRIRRHERPRRGARRCRSAGALGWWRRRWRRRSAGGRRLARWRWGWGRDLYTGIRGAIALAQGWELGRGVALLGLSSVECLAAQAGAEGLVGAVNVIIDAQRNEFYLARYIIDKSGWRETEALRLATRAEVQALAGAGQALLGPGIRQWFGSGTDMYAGAVMLGRLACGRRDFVPGEKLAPIYLRETAFKKAPPPRGRV